MSAAAESGIFLTPAKELLVRHQMLPIVVDSKFHRLNDKSVQMSHSYLIECMHVCILKFIVDNVMYIVQ